MAFYCNGKKDICECDILCADCQHYDNTGGKKTQTNADRIRAMSDEELAKLLSNDARACPDRITRCHDYGLNCERCWLEWLKQPVKENDNG